MGGSEPANASVAGRERAFFDQLVQEQGDFNPFADRGWNVLRAQFRRMIQPTPTAALLDVGCGTGHSRQIYLPGVGRYTGIDLSAEAIAAAQRAFPDDRWLVADACDLPMADAAFDIVAFSSVLHHIPDFGVALREACRVLKPGGQVFAFDPHLYHPAMALFRHPGSPCYLSQGVSPDERPLTARHLRREFEAAGFQQIAQRCQSNLPYRRVAPKLLNAALGAYNAVDWVWEQTGLGRLFGTFVLTGGRKPE